MFWRSSQWIMSGDQVSLEFLVNESVAPVNRVVLVSAKSNNGTSLVPDSGLRLSKNLEEYFAYLPQSDASRLSKISFTYADDISEMTFGVLSWPEAEPFDRGSVLGVMLSVRPHSVNIERNLESLEILEWPLELEY